jgi:hypothetical protein
MALKDIGKNTPAVEVIRRVLEEQGKPMSLEELTVSVLSTWGRDFPNTPYEQIPLIYKLATNTLSCTVSFEDAGGKVPIIKREDGAEDEVALSPELGPHDLNLIVDRLKHVKVALPA